MKKLFKIITRYIQPSFLIFIIIGVCTFSLDYFLYIIFLHQNLPMNIAKAASSIIAVIFNYLFNSRFNFGGNNVMGTNFLITYTIMYGVLIFIHVLINRIFFLILNQEQSAVILAMSISVFINYYCVKRFFLYQQNK